MALNAHGYERMTSTTILGDHEGFAALKARVLGLGYVLELNGSKGFAIPTQRQRRPPDQR